MSSKLRGPSFLKHHPLPERSLEPGLTRTCRLNMVPHSTFSFSPRETEKYLHKQLPRLPAKAALNPQECLQSSCSERIIRIEREKLRLQQENEALRGEIRFYQDLYVAAKELLRSSQKSITAAQYSVRRFRAREQRARQAREEGNMEAKRIGRVYDADPT